MLSRAKEVALAGLWICLASASSALQVQIALGVVATIQIMLVFSQHKTRADQDTPHVGGGITSSTAAKELI